jgi:hypothetical protein
MGIHVVWDDDAHTCVRYDVHGHWSLGDLKAARRDLEAMIAGRQDEMTAIIELRTSQSVPDGLFVHFGNRSYSVSGHIGLMVFVGANGIIKGLVASYQRIYRHKTMEWEFADDLQGARRIVKEYRFARSPLEQLNNSVPPS